jgi:hypothetical protein
MRERRDTLTSFDFREPPWRVLFEQYEQRDAWSESCGSIPTARLLDA